MFKIAIIEDPNAVSIDMTAFTGAVAAGGDFDDLFCTSLPDFCVSGAMDILKVCDNMYMLPYELIEQTGLTNFCGIDTVTACKAFPDLCDTTGAISLDLCKAYPEKCDESKPAEFNPCAKDLTKCLLDPTFSPCGSFPELCGIKTEYVIPPFHGNGQKSAPAGTGFRYTCKTSMKASG